MNFIDKMRMLMRRTQAEYREPANRLLNHISNELLEFSERLETEVESDASGKQGPPQGSIEMSITYIDGDILSASWNDPHYVSEKDIKGTSGYHELERRARELGVTLRLEVEDDDRYTEDDYQIYTIVVSGWSSQVY